MRVVFDMASDPTLAPAPKEAVAGLHHVTAIAGDPQRNVDFYTRALGLRLVKKTVNFDAPDAYHLYFGDTLGSPGTILTFFYWPGLGQRGRPGQGQVLAFSFSVPLGSLDAWRRHLEGSGFPVEGRRQVFGEEALTLRDPDGFLIELIETKDSRAPGAGSGFVPESLAIRGFHTAPLGVASAAASTRHLVEDLGFRLVRNEAGRSRFEAGAGGPGTFADIVVVPQKGMPGLGTIHHVAWRVPDDATEAAFVRQLGTAGYSAGPVRDRSYFRSIYWREPSGILYEIATDVPGFAHDEPEATLGEALKLPAQFERFRAEIEASLPPVSAPKPE